MNAYCISKIYADWTGKSKTADTTELTEDNVLTVFDKFMTDMDNARVPRAGRILYVTPDTRTLLTTQSRSIAQLMSESSLRISEELSHLLMKWRFRVRTVRYDEDCI